MKMKQESCEFRPVTITLTSAKEAEDFWKIIREWAGNRHIQKIDWREDAGEMSTSSLAAELSDWFSQHLNH